MRARRIRLDLALALIVAMAVAAAALVHEGTAASSTVTPGSPAPVADTFSRAYLGYLDGSVALDALPDATSQVRSLGVTTILAPPAHVPAPPSALRLAASRFATHYVDYREGASHALPAALPAMRRQIQTGQDPLVATTPTHAPARLESLVLGPVADGAVAARAILVDAGAQVPVEFDLQQTAAGWQAWGFPEGSS
jgi:hypothetical protein